ncbi:MAG: TIGR00269 family protein [Candidatus Micrarchaeota archaeon]|nr:TIGR00269 family protein [Candidatus Micrarchaeota archaeon]
MLLKLKSGTPIQKLLQEMGICSQEVLVFIDGKISPETSIAKKGQKVSIIYFKHGAPQSGSALHKQRKYEKCECGGIPVYFAPHLGRHFCKKHFLEYFEKKARTEIRQKNLIKKGEKIALGLSGGKDSFSMLHFLSHLKGALPFQFFAITIDEGVKGYREHTINRAKKFCKKLKVKHHVYTFEKEEGITLDSLSKEGKANCSVCAVLRRRLLNSKARKLGASKLIIAHNLDDTAQTVLLNVVRNEPLRFARMEEPLVQSKSLIQRIKPFATLSEKEVATYAYLHGYDYGEGACCCPYVQHAIRRFIRHQLNLMEEAYPSTKLRIAASGHTLQKAIRETIPKEKLKINSCEICGEPSSGHICKACSVLKPKG